MVLIAYASRQAHCQAREEALDVFNAIATFGNEAEVCITLMTRIAHPECWQRGRGMMMMMMTMMMLVYLGLSLYCNCVEVVLLPMRISRKSSFTPLMTPLITPS
jgi:hypothetical protein